MGLPTALTPVMFAYGGWQTASFVAGEMRDPRRDLARGLLMGVVGVVVPLHRGQLHLRRASSAPPGSPQRAHRPAGDAPAALGETGANLIALGVASELAQIAVCDSSGVFHEAEAAGINSGGNGSPDSGNFRSPAAFVHYRLVPAPWTSPIESCSTRNSGIGFFLFALRFVWRVGLVFWIGGKNERVFRRVCFLLADFDIFWIVERVHEQAEFRGLRIVADFEIDAV